MKMKHFLVGACLLVPSLAIAATAQARTHQTYGSEEGREGRCSVLERRLHDRPRPKPMRRAHVGLWQPPSGFTVIGMRSDFDRRGRAGHVDLASSELLRESHAAKGSALCCEPLYPKKRLQGRDCMRDSR